jgi:hypothetical protein
MGCNAPIDERESVLDGTILQTYSTQWFDFTVISVRTSKQIDQYLPYADAYQFLIVTILEKNTYNEAIPMSCWDFCLEAQALKEEDRWARSDFEGDPTIMPTQFILEPGESIAYDLIFCIPENLPSVGISYSEIDEKNQEGATFIVNFDVPPLQFMGHFPRSQKLL